MNVPPCNDFLSQVRMDLHKNQLEFTTVPISFLLKDVCTCIQAEKGLSPHNSLF